MVLAAAPTHRLARKPVVEPNDLDGLDFVTFDNDLPISREISRYLRQNGVEVNTIMRFDNIQTIKEAVMLGSGVSLVPLRILRSELAAGRLAAASLAVPLSRPVGIVHRKKKRFHRAAQAFLDLLVAWDGGVDVRAPAVDAAGHALGGGDALPTQPVDDVRRPDAVMAEDH